MNKCRWIVTLQPQHLASTNKAELIHRRLLWLKDIKEKLYHYRCAMPLHYRLMHASMKYLKMCHASRIGVYGSVECFRIFNRDILFAPSEAANSLHGLFIISYCVCASTIRSFAACCSYNVPSLEIHIPTSRDWAQSPCCCCCFCFFSFRWN